MPLHNERLKLEQEKLRQRRRANQPVLSITTSPALTSKGDTPEDSMPRSAVPFSQAELFSPVVPHNLVSGQSQRLFFAQADEFQREAAELQQELQDMWEVLSRR